MRFVVWCWEDYGVVRCVMWCGDACVVQGDLLNSEAAAAARAEVEKQREAAEAQQQDIRNNTLTTYARRAPFEHTHADALTRTCTC